MDNETFVARVAQYYTIDDYANYAVIYFKNINALIVPDCLRCAMDRRRQPSSRPVH